MRFALGCWQQMIDSQQYRSVLMYKNKGPLSGGSLVHPHMQIVGLEQEDGYAALTSANFEGVNVWQQGESRSTSQPNRSWGSLRSMFQSHRNRRQRRRPRPSRSGPVCRCDSGGPALYPARTPRRSRGVVQLVLLPHGRPDHCQGVATLVVSPYFVGYRLAQVNAETTLDIDAERLRAHLETLV